MRRLKLVSLVAIFAAVFVGMITAAVPASAAAPCQGTHCHAQGTLELAGSDWLGGKGVDVRANAGSAQYSSHINHYVTVANRQVWTGEEWQCVEMINRLYLARGWITDTWKGNGNELYGSAPSNLTTQANGNISYLNPGDVISLSDGGPGHAGVVDSVSGSTVNIINQNTASVTSSATFSKGTLTMNGGWSPTYSVIGVIHRPSGMVGGGTSTGRRNTSDLNNDGTDDALLMTSDPGPATGANPGLSTSTGFWMKPEWWHDPYTDWNNMTPLVGDVTGDSKADLVYLIPTPSGTQAWVLPSTGNAFQAPQLWWNGIGYQYGGMKVALGDVNGDGTEDLVLATSQSGGGTAVSVALSTGTGLWLQPPWWVDPYTEWNVMRLLVGDVTGDGVADVAYLVPTSQGTTAWVLPSTKTGLRSPQLWWNGVGYQYSGIKATFGDMDGNGADDLVLATSQSDGGTAVSVALSTYTGFWLQSPWWTDRYTDWNNMTPFVGNYTGDYSNGRPVADFGYIVPTQQGVQAWVLRSTKSGLQAPQSWWVGAGWGYGGVKVAAR